MGIKKRQQRSARLKQSIILRLSLDDIKSFCLKWAETRDELAKAFTLVYEEYARSGYIKNGNPYNMHFSLHHLLPETAVLIMQYYQKTISTLSLVTDSEHFGLPMDAIYRKELDELRGRNLKLMEVCALATSEEFRLRNIILYLFRQTYWHAVNTNANGICIMVNPKHSRFYKTILLFKEIGSERLYPRLKAPAVALKLNLGTYKEKMKKAYGDFPPESNLYDFLYHDKDLSKEAKKLLFNIEDHNKVSRDVLKYFIKRLSKDQRDYYTERRPELLTL